MPEGSEVKRMTDQLLPLVDQRISRPVLIDNSNRYARTGIPGMDQFIKESTSASWSNWSRLDGIHCKGKFIWFEFEMGWYLMNTLGMTGQWLIRTTNENAAHDVMRVKFMLGFYLIFSDQRHMGTLKFTKSRSELDAKLARLGPDMLSNPCDVTEFVDRLLKKPNRDVCQSIMDQSVISGVGNYVKSESLYLSGISPERRVVDLTSNEFESLHANVTKVLRASYKAGGAYLMNYRDLAGEPGGTYQKGFVAYKKEYCPLGHSIVSKETKDGRTSWWCPECQK